MSFHDSAMRWNGWGPRDDALSEAQWRWLAGRLAMPALLATPPRALADIALPPPRLTDAAWTHFRRFGDVRQDPHSRAAHAAGRGLLDMLRLRAGDVGTAPDAVISPKSEDDVLALLKLCAELDIAVVPFGGGTSLVGGVTPRVGHHKAVISLDMRGMARVLAVDALVGLATVEAGISGPELERQLGAHGMTLGHHPGSFAFSTLGGWIAHNGAGQDMAAHGRARDWLAGVRMATPQGLFTARAADAGGPGLVHIALGSEGTLGVITAATVRVSALPAQEDHRRYVFADFTRGLEAIRRAVQDGVPHSMLRLSDACETAFARDLARAGRRLIWRVDGKTCTWACAGLETVRWR